MGNRQASLDLGSEIIRKDLRSQPPGTSLPFPVLHPTGTKSAHGPFSPSSEKNEASPSFHLRIAALHRDWESPDALSLGAEDSRDSPWPLPASVSPSHAEASGVAERPPCADAVGLHPPATAAPTWGGALGLRGRAVGGRAGNGRRPKLPGAFKEEKPAGGGAGPGKCRGIASPSRPGGGAGGQRDREGVTTGCPARPAPRPCRGRLASLPSAARATRARDLGGPHRYPRRP